MLSEITWDSEARKNLFLVFKEIINNAAKYSKADHVKINMNRNHRAWRMDISDNGIGFEPLTNTSGNGLNNIRRTAASRGRTLPGSACAASGAAGELLVLAPRGHRQVAVRGEQLVVDLFVDGVFDDGAEHGKFSAGRRAVRRHEL